MATWKELENNIRQISQLKWNCNSTSETISGVSYDCVLKPELDRWIIVEATENIKLTKVREDIAKHNSTRFNLISKGIHVSNYIVMDGEPTESMKSTGKDSHVKVMSYKDFSQEFIDFKSYAHVRSSRIFGSAVNPFSGEADKTKYTPVHYDNLTNGKEIRLKDISKLLQKNKNIVLLGNYGTGKSRCIKELFEQLKNNNLENDKFLYPIAINLKENWGTKRAEEIIRRHFDDLGLSQTSDSIIKLLDSENLIFLLDGFDEIGAQTWSDDPSRLLQIRSQSLSGIKDLINKTNGSIIVTGREHYFNSQKEMLNALGLQSQTNPAIIVKCSDEFTDEEMQVYLKSLSTYIALPAWLPKRPLICQIINELDKETIERLFVDTNNSVEFWKTLMRNICERESRIRSVLDADTIYSIFVAIAETTRSKVNALSPITMSEINEAFDRVVGTPPVDESALMLQRLPGLGRVSSESRDRQFIDKYILDGLLAQNLAEYVEISDEGVKEEKWNVSLGTLGLEFIANRMREDKTANVYIEYLKGVLDSPNSMLRGDILGSLLKFANNNILDLKGITIAGTEINEVDLSHSLLDNFSIEDSIIDTLDVSTTSSSKVVIKNCIIQNLHGVSSKKEIPDYLMDNEIENFINKPLKTQSEFNLTNGQMIFISIVKKIYLSPNNGKEEEELLSNCSSTDKDVSRSILSLLTKEKIIGKSSDKGSTIYKSKAFHESRVQKILAELDKSNDDLWVKVSEL